MTASSGTGSKRWVSSLWPSLAGAETACISWRWPPTMTAPRPMTASSAMRRCDALRRLKEFGRRLILVTGRELPDLQRVFPELDLCDLAVRRERRAALRARRPAARRRSPIRRRRPSSPRLRERDVQPLSVGRSIVATWEPMETVVLETIRELGLELQITFNKGAVMVLPRRHQQGQRACGGPAELGLSRHNVVAVGDAENDHAFLSSAAAPSRSPMRCRRSRTTADLVTAGARGDGVIELIDQLLDTDLRRRRRTLDPPSGADRRRRGRRAGAARSSRGQHPGRWRVGRRQVDQGRRHPGAAGGAGVPVRRRSIPRATMPSSRVPWCWATPARRPA